MSRSRKAVTCAPAKVNLHLAVVGHRDDGYHLLNTLMVPVSLCDTVSVSVSARKVRQRPVTCSVTGPEKVAGGADNLAARAARAVLAATGKEAAVRVQLYKRVPWGAGLGGGSSDAAAVLKLLPKVLGVPLSAGRVRKIAVSLGADVPFFLGCRPAVATGIGDELAPVSGFPPMNLLVAVPRRRIDTAWAFANALKNLTSCHRTNTDIRLLLSRGRLRNLLHNDLETGIRSLVPDVDRLARRMAELGAQATVMSGSGSAVVGLFASRERCDVAAGSFEKPDRAFSLGVLRSRPSVHRDER